MRYVAKVSSSYVDGVHAKVLWRRDQIQSRSSYVVYVRTISKETRYIATSYSLVAVVRANAPQG